MRIKKFMSVLLVMALMFSFCSFFVSAADDGVINTRDLDFSASVQVLNSSGTSTVQHDVTNDVTVDTTNAEVVKVGATIKAPAEITDYNLTTSFSISITVEQVD